MDVLMPRPRDRSTLDLFEWEPPQVAVGFSPETLRGGSLTSKVARAIGKALRDSDKTRDVIAAEMSQLLGQSISKTMIDAYASEAKESHRITLERTMAVIAVTNCHDLLGFIAGEFGYAVVPEKYADIIELHLIEEHEGELAKRKTALEARWRRGR